MLSQQDFSEKIITWYNANKRDLPWRNTQNPYYIWLSEIILQQTRVAQGMPYYERFVEKYPTLKDLANAPIDDVLRLWQGLGYYSRARNMHTTAKYIFEDLQDVFPLNYKALLSLKGVGTYTAAAIASFAYNEAVAVLDGNVFRVLARVFGESTDISSPAGAKVFSKLSNEMLDKTNASLHNQAIMEFGALQCTPAKPNCMYCPLASECVAYTQGKQNILPIKNKKIKVKERFFDYFIFRFNNKIALRKRLDNDIWSGLYDFYLVENKSEVFLEDENNLNQTLENNGIFDEENIEEKTTSKLSLESREILGKEKTTPNPSLGSRGVLGKENYLEDAFMKDNFSFFSIKKPSKTYKHILTHQKIKVRFFEVEIKEINDKIASVLVFYDLGEIKALPKPILIANYLEEYYF